MSEIKYKQSSAGLNLANKHLSARSQVNAETVYSRVDRAKTRDKSLPASVRISRGVQAIRMGLDRISRIGERLRENKNVAAIDHKLMTEEFGHLQKELSTIFRRAMGQSVVFNEDQNFDLAKNPLQFDRLIDAVYSGTIKLEDRFDQIGQLLDFESDDFVMNFSGLFEVNKNTKLTSVISSIDSLSSKAFGTSQRNPIPLENEVEGESYVNSAIDRVSNSILTQAQSASSVHLANNSMKNISLLFDDALGNSKITS